MRARWSFLVAGAWASATLMAQEVTPVWLQHVNGVVNVLPENKLPILVKAGGTGDNTYAFDGTDVIDSYAVFMKYDDTHYLLGIRENGINEKDANLSQQQKDYAAQFPDRSIIWIDAATGKPLGLALKTEVLPVPLGASSQSPTHAWWKWGITDGPHGERVIYTGYKYKILRYAAGPLVDDANFPNKRPTWSTTPTEAWVEPVPDEPNPTIVPGDRGTEPGESGGDGSASWRWKGFRVTGHGANLRIIAGGGTWRASMQAQEFVTDDSGLTLRPIARVDERNNNTGGKGSYALGGEASSIRYDVNDSTAKGSAWMIQAHYPGAGWDARPNRYIKNPNELLPDGSANDYTNRFRNVDAATGALPAFRWEAAGKDGIPITHAVDGVEYYDGNWVLTSDTIEGRDYIVTYAIPSWNQQFGSVGTPGAIFKPGWLGVHTLDGMIASGGGGYKIPVYETDEPIVDPNGNAGTGHDYGYEGDVYVYPDTSAPANSGRSLVLWSGGSYGFGVFKVENTAAQIVTAPAATEALENTKVSLTAVVKGSPNKYLWYKDGVALDPTNQAYAANLFEGANKAILTILDAKTTDSGNYQLKVTNPLGNVETTAVKLTIVHDSTPPTISSAVAQQTISSHLVRVVFSERIDTNTAADLSHYSISGGLTPQAVLVDDSTSVSLKTSAPSAGQEYTLTVTGVKDIAGNASTSSAKATFKAGTLTAGYALWEYFPGAPGTSVSDAYADPNFPDHATRTVLVTSFTTSPTLNNYADTFSGRMSAWLTPTESGQYRFFIKSDDSSELFLSTDDTLANAVSIATEPSCCHDFQEPADPMPTQTSTPISLVAGKKYLLYAVYKEGGGGDNCSVAWRKEGDTTAAAGLPGIPGSLLTSYRAAPAEAGKFGTTTLSGGQVTITWTGAGVLQESNDLKSWANVTGNPASPYKVTPEGAARFYRLMQ